VARVLEEVVKKINTEKIRIIKLIESEEDPTEMEDSNYEIF